MKNITIIIFVVLFLYLMAGFSDLTAQQWSEPIYLSKGNNPDMVIDPESGELHIVSIVQSKGVVYVKMNKYGEKLDSVIVPNTEFEEELTNFGPTIAIDSQDYPHIGFRRHIGTSDRYDVFYTRLTETGWTTPLKVAARVQRGYVVRMAIDDHDIVHFAHGSIDPEWPNNTGPVHYYLLSDGSVKLEQHNIIQIRGDERFEIDVSPDGIAELVTSDFHYPPDPPDGGPLFYWRSRDIGDSLEYIGDLRHDDVKSGSIGSSDLFLDAAGNTHVCYGVERDRSIAQKVSVRYCRIENGIKVLDKRVTDFGELTKTDKWPVGVASIAAGENGQWICVAYTTTLSGPLYARFSDDGGKYWSSSFFIADGWNNFEGRNKHIIRAFRDDFYVVYPTDQGVYLRYINLTQNELPIAMLNTPDPAPEGSTIIFDASSSYDPDGEIVKYQWDFQNDGIYDDTTIAPIDSFTYTSEFSGEAKLTVFDNEGDSTSVTVPVSIFLIPNELPIAELLAPDSADEGSTVNFDASGSFDPDGTIVRYLWDFKNDGVYDDSTTASTTSFTYVDDFWGEVLLTVVDDRDDSVNVSSAITINNVVPSANAGGHYTGEWYQPVKIQGNATDPGILDTLIFEWDTDEDGLFETVGKNAYTPAYTQQDTHCVVLRVRDNNGGVGLDTTLIIIHNQPPIVSKISNQSIKEGERFSPLTLDDFVNDPDNPDSTISWSFSGLNNLSISVDSNRIATISLPNPSWSGYEVITFIATDPGGKFATTSAIFTFNTVDDPPIVNSIPAQTRYENQFFSNVNLDLYVDDPDDADSTLTWDYFNNDFFNINIIDRIATVAVIDSEWAGVDTVGFVVSDPKGLTDTALVTFSVIAINDPPEISPIENQIIYQDQNFLTVVLNDHVFDPDNADSSITWKWAGNIKLRIQITKGGILRVHKPDSTWVGSETIIFWATDDKGLYDLCSTQFTVKPGVDVHDLTNESSPETFALYPNYPNPFNPHTWIRYDIVKRANVRLSIYNQLGHEVRSLVNQTQNPGAYRILWDGRDNNGNKVSSGIYFYRIQADNFTRTMKMTLIF